MRGVDEGSTVNSETNPPEPSAEVSFNTSPSKMTLTLENGSACPATSTFPFGSTRTTSNNGGCTEGSGDTCGSASTGASGEVITVSGSVVGSGSGAASGLASASGSAAISSPTGSVVITPGSNADPLPDNSTGVPLFNVVKPKYTPNPNNSAAIIPATVLPPVPNEAQNFIQFPLTPPSPKVRLREHINPAITGQKRNNRER